MHEKELRLALSCYGGVSLAIYMHGVTREIWHLVRGSRNYFDKNTASTGSELIYSDLIAEIEKTTGTRLRVMADIIAGSSAGGINGVFLAQAIITGQSLEPLTDLWLQNADVETLLDPDARPLSRFSKFWAAPIAWAILRRRGGIVEQTVSAEARAEVTRKMSRFVRARWFHPPFGGTGFSKLLLDAFLAMEMTPHGQKLLPNGQPLDLFVTVTDFHGHDEHLKLNSPHNVTETEHRLTIGFSARNNSPLAEIPELIFAARATASFPGAFPPFSVRELDRLLLRDKLTWPGRNAFLKRVLPQQFDAGVVEDSYLIDGSVLANAPFNQAIDALRNRPARREVDRRFVYIDPKPGRPSFRFGRNKINGAGPKPVSRPPGFFATIFGATSNIPREQPIRDSLDKIEGRTARIERMSDVTDHLRIEIEQSIETMLGRSWFLSKPTPQRIAKWRMDALNKAAEAAGYSYPAYGHIRMAGIVDDMVATARRAWPEGPAEHFIALREAIWSELAKRGLNQLAGTKGIRATPQSIEFFRRQDVRFRIRRLRFLARRLAIDIETNLSGFDDQTDSMRDSIYRCLSYFLEVETSHFLGADFTRIVQAGVTDTATFIDGLGARRNLEALDITADDILCTALAQMPQEPQRSLLLGYIGYIFYDIATLPMLQGEGLDEFDPVKVDRISPEDALTIRKGGAVATLKGIEFNNFGAFFSRAYRENDYLWGRLHGVDRMIDIVTSSLPHGCSLPAGFVIKSKKRAFHAILDQETSRLTKIAPLINTLRQEIDAIEVEQ
jgi:patatin-related protein